MTPRLFWIPCPTGRLAIAARPRGGEWLAGEIAGLHRAGIHILISLLTHEEVVELDLEQESRYCAACGIDCRACAIPDRGAPADPDAFRSFMTDIAAELRAGRTIAVHCRAGIGRSALAAACLLGMLGVIPDEAFARISRARGCVVPDTSEQRAWVERFVASIPPGQ